MATLDVPRHLNWSIALSGQAIRTETITYKYKDVNRLLTNQIRELTSSLVSIWLHISCTLWCFTYKLVPFSMNNSEWLLENHSGWKRDASLTLLMCISYLIFHKRNRIKQLYAAGKADCFSFHDLNELLGIIKGADLQHPVHQASAGFLNHVAGFRTRRSDSVQPRKNRILF